MDKIEFNAGLFRMGLCFILIFLVIGGAAGYQQLYYVDHNAVPTFRFLGLGRIPIEYIPFIRYTLVLSLLAAALGIKTRLALILSAVTYFLYYGNQLGFSKSPFEDYVYHSKNLAFFTLVMLSIGRETTVFTLDNLRNNGWKGFSRVGNKIAGIPITTSIQLLIGIAYVGSAVTKLTNDISWLEGHTLQASLWKKYLLFDNELAYFLLHDFLLCQIFSYFTVFFELTFIIGIFIKRVRWFYVILGILFHLNIYLTMNINFGFYFYGLYLVFLAIPVPWKQPKINYQPFLKVWKVREFALVFILVFQAYTVAANFEAWPISSFGVFVKVSHVAQVNAYRYGLMEGDEITWLPRNDLARSQTNASSLIRRSIKAGKGEEYQRIYTEEVKNKLKRLGKDTTKLTLFKCYCEDISQPKLIKKCVPVKITYPNDAITSVNAFVPD